MEPQNIKKTIIKISSAAMITAIALLAITACALNPEIETIEIQASNNLPMDMNSSQPMVLKLTPEDADIDNINFISSNEEIVTVSSGEAGAIITSHDVGTASIYAISENGVQSNSVNIKVINELAERKKAQEKKEKRRQAALEKKETKTSSIQQRTATYTTSATSAGYESASQEYKEGYVYIPRTGHRYHKDSICSGMRNPSYVSISAAKKQGFTPCKKCYGYY